MDLSLLSLVCWLYGDSGREAEIKIKWQSAFMKNYYLFIAFAMVENLSTDVGLLAVKHLARWTMAGRFF